MILRYAALLYLIFSSCSKRAPEVSILNGDAFGTTYTIQYYANKPFKAQKGIDSVIYIVNKSVSTYLPNSDISKINKGDTIVKVDKIFKDIFLLSEEIHFRTKGYFDPTIGVLRNAYGFGDTAPLQDLNKKSIDSLMQLVGFTKVQLTSKGTIYKEDPNIYFDFNAIAKGYGIDLIGKYLERNGVSDFIIELGGEILTKGKNVSKGKSWIVGVEAVASEIDNRAYTATIKLKNKGMASSGNYRKFRVDSNTGKRYVHTINPLTGSAEKSDLTSATVVALNCAVADAYATAFMALGLEKSKTLLKDLDAVDAYLTYNDISNKEQVFVTKGFQKLLLK